MSGTNSYTPDLAWKRLVKKLRASATDGNRFEIERDINIVGSKMSRSGKLREQLQKANNTLARIEEILNEPMV